MRQKSQEKIQIADEAELTITQKHPEILEEPAVLESILLPLELYLLKEMLEKNSPHNTQALYNAVVRELFGKWFAREYKQRNIVEKNLSKESNENIRIIQRLFLLTQDQFGSVHQVNWIHQPSTKDIQMMFDVIKEVESPPSIYKIGKSMETLESWGFMTRRYESAGNTKFYWVLQPAFTRKYAPTIREYLKERKVNLEW